MTIEQLRKYYSLEKALEVAKKQNQDFHESLNRYEAWINKWGLSHGSLLGRRAGDRVILEVNINYWSVIITVIHDSGELEAIKF